LPNADISDLHDFLPREKGWEGLYPRCARRRSEPVELDAPGRRRIKNISATVLWSDGSLFVVARHYEPAIGDWGYVVSALPRQRRSGGLGPEWYAVVARSPAARSADPANRDHSPPITPRIADIFGRWPDSGGKPAPFADSRNCGDSEEFPAAPLRFDKGSRTAAGRRIVRSHP